MTRPLSKVAPDWWDYTTLDREILDDAARLTADDLLQLSRPGFKVVFYSHWWPGSSTSWSSTCAMPISGPWTNGWWMARLYLSRTL